MTTEKLTKFFGWCTVLNMALLLWWAVWMIFASDFVYQVQTLVIDISKEQMNVVHYSAMAFHKILIIVFNVIPYLVLKITR